MDKYYGNVCELDIIFNFQKAYFILDELLLAGEMQESSKKNVLRVISQQDSLEDMEVSNTVSRAHSGPIYLSRTGVVPLATPATVLVPLSVMPQQLIHLPYFRSRKKSQRSCSLINPDPEHEPIHATRIKI